jgi:PAT family beta-lactamase induction signal transducer AmpG
VWRSCSSRGAAGNATRLGDRDKAARVSEAVSDEAKPAKKPSFWDAFTNLALASMLGFGFSCGLPNPLIGSTLTSWLQTEGVTIQMIGLSGAFALPYNFKFLWAPFLDRYRIPFLGRRRGWILIAQILLVIALAVLGSIDPSAHLGWIGVAAVTVAFLSASQDVVTDAYRTDLFPASQRASAAGIFVAAYRGAMIVATSLALILSDVIEWRFVYWIMAALMSIGIVTTLLAPAPESEGVAPRNLLVAVVDPFVEYFTRHRGGRGLLIAIAFLLVIMFYKVGDVVAGHLLNPFLQEVGFSRTEIGVVNKGLGLAATIVGALAGGGLVARFGLKRALIGCGIAQATSNLAYAAVAVAGKNYVVMTAAIGIDNLMNGLGTAAFVALLTSLCNKKFSAFQYALFSSLGTVVGRSLGAGSGWVVEWTGWPMFFLISLAVSLPALVMLAIVPFHEPNEAK